MADGLCSESDRKQFAAALINENGSSAGEKLGKCVKSTLKNRVASVTVSPNVVETVKRCLNREQQNMTTTGPQQQQSKKVLDAKLSKNKSASMSSSLRSGCNTNTSQGVVGLGPAKGPSSDSIGTNFLTTTGVGVVSVGGGISVVAGKSNNTSRASAEIEKIVPQKVKNMALQTKTTGAGLVAISKLKQKKDLESAYAANVDMAAARGNSDLQTGQQQDADDNPSAKKKRCSDRYDSSESSDSGVATLSCTDSSTASSDASDPGSPYSPVSLGEDANQSSTKANMPPQTLSITPQNHRVHHQTSSTTPHQTSTATHHQQSQKQQQHQTTTTVQHQWPWNVSSNSNTISNHNNNTSNTNNNLIVNASNKNSNNSSVNSALSGNSNASVKTKRILATNPSDINGTAKKVRTSALSTERMHSQSGLTAAASKRLKAQQEESQSQTKITGYFKSQMKPLKAPLKTDLNSLLTRTTNGDAQTGLTSAATGALDKYFNALASKTSTVSVNKDDKEQINLRKSVAIKKDFAELPPLTKTMPPSLKKLDRKSAKVAQVAPISRKTAVGHQMKSPKKHIAIAPRTMEAAQTQKPPSSNAFQIDQTKISQPTVLLTAIRIPPQTGAQTQQQLGATGTVSQTSTKAPPLTPTKMGSMLQIPVVPNLVQIPNLLATTNGTNLVMNNGQLTRVGAGGQYFLNGAVLKLQQISSGHTTNTNSTNGMLTVDPSTLQGNILVKPSTTISQSMPIVTSSVQGKTSALAIQQPIVAQAQINGTGCHQAFLAAANQRISTQPVLMATTSGWYVLNQSTSADSISSNIPHQATLTTAMMCKSPRNTITSLANTVNPPVPPLATLSSKHEPISVLGSKLLPPSKPTIISPIPADKKEKLLCPMGMVEPEKPLTVECPPLESLSEFKLSATAFANHKIESPKIATISAKLPSSPTIITTTKVEEEKDTPSLAANPKCAISPILSQPKTIRFPVPSGCEAGYRFGPKGPKRSDGVCYWDQCSEKYDTCSKLLDHLQTEHVNTQTGPFACLWSGCKVRGRESCSRRWLERHVLSHGGTKPFKCIVDGCGLRLGSQLALQKHVNGHFNATENKDNPSKRASDPPIPKVLRKNGKKARYRRQPFSARMFDFFDTGIMEGLQHRLMVTGSLASGSRGAITFQGRTIARRTTESGITELYVKWSPSEIIQDEWVAETTGALTKTIQIQSMRYQERFALQHYLKTTSSQRDISIKAISKSQSFPCSVSSLSSLFNDCESNSSGSSSAETSPSMTSCGTKQSRKAPKRNSIEPS